MIAAKLKALGITARIVEGELVLEGSRALTETEAEWVGANWEALWRFAGGENETALACAQCARLVADNPRQLAELEAKHGPGWSAIIGRIRLEASAEDGASWNRCLRCQLRDRPPPVDDPEERAAIENELSASACLPAPARGLGPSQEGARGEAR